VIVLDGHGEPVVPDEGVRRYATFAEGPCPTLVSLAEMELSDGSMACHPVHPTDDRDWDGLDPADGTTAERRPAPSSRPRPLYAIRGGA